ncbi:Flp pilus assembly protein CpaB [Methylolobus aquaticus]|nr:Flp pilus assembly protein CpaB [Methylolobus aquaticus]
MKARLLSMFVAAVILAGMAAWMAKRYIEQRAAPAPAQIATTPVVVAAGDIPFAAKIEPKHLKLVDWPSQSLPAGAVSDPKQVEGKVAQRSFVRDEPITRERLRDHLGGSTLSAMIKPGMRAISLRVDDVAGVAGFILPGNKVDILGTLPDKDSYTVLSGVNVLAVDQEASPEKNQPALVRALTVEVSPQQAELLDQAGHRSPLRFTLRNPHDEQPAPRVPAVPVPPPALRAPVSPPRVAPAPAPVPKAPTLPTLTVIEWTGKGQVVVERCTQWPCGGRVTGGGSPLPATAAPHSELLNSISAVGQAVE